MAKKTSELNIIRNESLRRPQWLKVKFGAGDTFQHVRGLVDHNNLNTVCESARCPNLGECWSRGTATFMLLGNICTRSCRFCNIEVKKPEKADIEEPYRVADAVRKMNLKHVVLTMVAHDDLKDSGAFIVAETIRQIKKIKPGCSVEALISDLKGSHEHLNIVLHAKPDILNHNLETVKRLQKELRVQATYERSLQILTRAKESGFVTKSGIMLGVGETAEEIFELLTDLRNIDCDIITIGQYLPPTKAHFPLHRFYTPQEFKDLKDLGLELGFKHVESGPLVRSSYHAEEHVYRHSF